MSQIEFYSHARFESEFRIQKIEEARYQKRMAIGFAIAMSAAWLSYAAYAEITEKRWPAPGSVLILLVLCMSLYSNARSRLGALQAMELKEPNQPPLRMPVSGTPAAEAPVAPPPGIAGR
jgi:hypothetical protein